MGEILINQLFAGAYLQEGTNIGHEVINLFRDDNDENYLYITPMGNVKGHNVDKVLFVQNIAGRETMEIVMKAEGLSNASADDVKKIFYAGVNIADIFNKNLYHGEAETTKTNSMATYCAKDVRFPKKGKRIIITVDSSYEVEDVGSCIVEKDISYQRDNDSENNGNASSSAARYEDQEKTVYTVDSQGRDIPYISKQLLPSIEGILIVTDGADRENVKKQMEGAVLSLFDLDEHKIAIVKMKSKTG